MLRADRVRRAIRPMVLPSEVLERRALFSVNPTAFLPQIVTQYWGYTDTMYEGDLTVDTTTSSSTSTVTLSDGTFTYDYIDTYSQTPANSSGDFTWSVNDWETELWSLTDTRTDSAGYAAHDHLVYIRDEHRNRVRRCQHCRGLYHSLSGRYREFGLCRYSDERHPDHHREYPQLLGLASVGQRHCRSGDSDHVRVAASLLRPGQRQRQHVGRHQHVQRRRHRLTDRPERAGRREIL